MSSISLHHDAKTWLCYYSEVYNSDFFLLSKHMLEVAWICNEYIMLVLSAKISAVKFLIR